MRFEDFTPRERVVLLDALQSGGSDDPEVRPWMDAAAALEEELEALCGEAEDQAQRDLNEEGRR